MTIWLDYTLLNGKQCRTKCHVNLGRPLIAGSAVWNRTLRDRVEDGYEEEKMMEAAGESCFNQVAYHAHGYN